MQQEIVQVDAFTNIPFTGNPAGICIMDAPADPVWMQRIAMEMNLSETAFVWPLDGDLLSLRWFTPTAEVDLCGHATIAAAHVLWEWNRLAAGATAKFQTRSGLLAARRIGDWIELDFPSLPPQVVPAPAGLIESLGDNLRSRVVAVGRSRFDFLVELDLDQAGLVTIAPDMSKLAQVEARAVIVTTRRAKEERFDFVSRFFAPRCGINEDPVTGSSHCALAPWWGERLKKETMLAYQASPRGGVVRVTVRGDRVLLGGQAVTVIRAALVV
jgi:PhzF family phenazine biosynthesis protein